MLPRLDISCPTYVCSGTWSNVSSFSLIFISALFVFTLVSFVLTFSPAYVLSSVSSFSISYSSQLELARNTTSASNLIGQFSARRVCPSSSAFSIYIPVYNEQFWWYLITQFDSYFQRKFLPFMVSIIFSWLWRYIFLIILKYLSWAPLFRGACWTNSCSIESKTLLSMNVMYILKFHSSAFFFTWFMGVRIR